VGDENATVGGTLEGTEHTVTGRGAAETDVEVALEGAGLVVTDCRVSVPFLLLCFFFAAP
jgi:hypothetical protein